MDEKFPVAFLEQGNFYSALTAFEFCVYTFYVGFTPMGRRLKKKYEISNSLEVSSCQEEAQFPFDEGEVGDVLELTYSSSLEEENNFSSDNDAANSSRSASNNILKLYLEEINKVPLLTQEEEIALSAKIIDGEKAVELLSQNLGLSGEEIKSYVRKKILDHSPNRIPTLSLEAPGEYDFLKMENLIKTLSDEDKKLLQRVFDGEQARKRFIESNLRLVVKIAKSFIKKPLPLLDLIQEGNRGLIRAVEKFEYKRGVKFSTYASWWVRQYIQRAINEQARLIRLPGHITEALSKISRLREQFLSERGSEPTYEEIAERLGDKWSAKQVEYLLFISQEALSLDHPVGEENEGDVFGSFISDKQMISPEDYADGQVTSEVVEEMLSILDEREALVLRLKSGLIDGREYTFDEIAKMLKISRERARQIEKRAIRKIKKHSSLLKSAKDFLE